MAVSKDLKANSLVASKIDNCGKALNVTPGSGAVGTGLAQKITTCRIDGVYQTKVYFDLEGLSYSNVVGDAVGLDAGGAGGAAYLFKWQTGTMGSTLIKAELMTLEIATAATNAITDLDIISCADDTIIEDGSVSGEADAKALLTGGMVDTLLEITTDTTPESPAAEGDAVYVAVGAAPGGADEATAGRFVATFYAIADTAWDA